MPEQSFVVTQHGNDPQVDGARTEKEALRDERILRGVS